MITREEACWLYRCILGREPESESVLRWTMANSADFQSARRRFLSSLEFQKKQGRILRLEPESYIANKARHDSIVGQLSGSSVQMVRQTNDSLTMTGGFSDLLRALKARLRVQCVAVFGGAKAICFALDLLRECGIRPSALLVNRSQVDQNLSLQAIIEEAGASAPSGLSIFEKFGHPDELLAQIETNSIRPEMVICDDHRLSADAFLRAHRCLSRYGAVLVDLSSETSRKEYETAARRSLIDAVSLDGFGLLQRSYWLTPLTFRPEPEVSFSKDGAKPTIALAVIAKNETANLPKMLRSCLPLIDFVALVDTGSTDGTLLQAESILKGEAVAYELKEIEFKDFSDARNAALSLVPRDFDWILMLDCDEHLVSSDYVKLMELLEGDHDGWMLPRYNFLDLTKLTEPAPYPDRQRRLFRNKRFKFSGKVHETLQGVRSWGMAPANLSFFGGNSGGPHIHHLGQANISRERWSDKNAFYTSLLK